MLCIPEAMAVALKLEQQSEREVTGADGRTMRVPYVGPVKVTFQDRLCLVGALVLGDDVLLGAVPMEDMDLTIHPSRQQLEPDPRHRTTPHVLVRIAHLSPAQDGAAQGEHPCTQPAQISASCNCKPGKSGVASSTSICSSRCGAPLAGHTSTAC